MCLCAQLCPTLCNLGDCSLPSFSVHGILQTRILEWVSIPFSRGPSDPGIEPMSPVSPAVQVNSSPAEPSGKPRMSWVIIFCFSNSYSFGWNAFRLAPVSLWTFINFYSWEDKKNSLIICSPPFHVTENCSPNPPRSEGFSGSSLKPYNCWFLLQ